MKQYPVLSTCPKCQSNRLRADSVGLWCDRCDELLIARHPFIPTEKPVTLDTLTPEDVCYLSLWHVKWDGAVA